MTTTNDDITSFPESLHRDEQGYKFLLQPDCLQRIQLRNRRGDIIDVLLNILVIHQALAKQQDDYQKELCQTIEEEIIYKKTM